MIVIVGPSSSGLYKNTTPVKLAEFSAIPFSKSAPKVNRRLEPNVLIRYGSSSFPRREWRYVKVVNTAKAIKKTSDKLGSSRCLISAGLPVPPIFTTKEEIKESDLPVIRRTLHHTRGSDIKLVTSLKNIPNGDYYSKFIESKAEYRVHVFDGEVIRIQLKVKGEEPPEEEMDDFIHNYENGFLLKDTYTHDLELEKSLFDICIQAVALLGLDFGAVDVLIGKDGKPYILEVNSAPRLNKYGRQLYTLYIYRKLGWDIDMKALGRVRENKGRCSNDLPIEFREIISTN